MKQSLISVLRYVWSSRSHNDGRGPLTIDLGNLYTPKGKPREHFPTRDERDKATQALTQQLGKYIRAGLYCTVTLDGLEILANNPECIPTRT